MKLFRGKKKLVESATGCASVRGPGPPRLPAAAGRHVHPITIAQNLAQVLYLVIIPVVRGFVLALGGDFARWLRGAWLDIAVLLVMLTVAVWRWWIVTYTVTDRAFTLRAGWLRRRRIRIPWSRVTTLSVIDSFYLRPFGASKLRADTLGGSAGEPDFSILVARRDADALLAMQRPAARGGSARYVPRVSSILALSLLTSNSLSGVVFLATLVSQSGRLLGNEFSERLAAAFQEVTRALAFGLPPAAAGIAYVLLAGWLIGFLLTFFRYKNFEVAVGDSERSLDVGGGILTGRAYRIRFSDINFIEIRQSFATRILRLYSLYISAVGYGKQQDDMSCIIPTEGAREFRAACSRLFPRFTPRKRQVFPGSGAIFRYISNPLLISAGVVLATVILVRVFPDWGEFITFIGLMSLVPALFFLVIGVMDHATAGVAKSGRFYTLRYSRGFYLHTVVIPADKIVELRVRQSIIQRITRTCDLFVFTRAEGRVRHHCRSLSLAGVEALLQA